MEGNKTVVPQATPGPFVVDYNTPDLPFRVYSKSTQSNVAYFHNEADAEAFSNARNSHSALIAALRDSLRMLEAVRYSAGLGKSQLERIAAARAALAAAEQS